MNIEKYWSDWKEWREWSLNISRIPFGWKSDPLLLELNIRLSIFIITGVCAGLPALVWSVSDIIHHRKNGHRISIFILLLLLTDFLEILLSPYILIKLLLNEIPCYMDWTCWAFWTLWWTMRDCGLLLNQLVALEGILSVKYTASVFSSPCLRIFQIIILLCVIFWNFSFNFFYFFYRMYFVWDVLFMFTVSVIPLITCGTSCCADRHSHTSRKSDYNILVILIFTLLMLYLPYPFIFTGYFRSLVFNILFILTSLRLMSDPLLCVLVCRQNLSLQTSQKPKEASLV